MKRSLLILSVLIFSAFVGGASADHVTLNDPADARGPLDVKAVGHSGGAFPKWRIDTFNKWSRQTILDQGFLTVYLDTFGSDRHDYYALIWSDKDRMRANLIRDRQKKSDYTVRALRVRRSSSKSVNVTVGLNKLRISDDSATYNWYVQTFWSGKGCSHVCFDWAPDVGKDGEGIEEPLPLSS